MNTATDLPPPPSSLRERGQATAEYVLVMLGAAAVALLVLAWATSTSKISTLLNRVVDSLISGVA